VRISVACFPARATRRCLLRIEDQGKGGTRQCHDLHKEGIMKSSRGYIGLGILLIALGVLALLGNLDVFSFNLVGDLIWGLLFGIAGLVFLAVFLTDMHERWWAVIPGFTLLGLAALIGFGDRLGALGAGLFLAAIGLSFWVIYLVRREFWWAIIPGGVLITVAFIAGLADSLPELTSGGVLFLGLAATFGLVYLLSEPGERKRWALIPAGILAVMGLLLMFSLGNLINYLWAIALILGGGFLVVRALMKRT
jgi:hypothetical protein